MIFSNTVIQRFNVSLIFFVYQHELTQRCVARLYFRLGIGERRSNYCVLSWSDGILVPDWFVGRFCTASNKIVIQLHLTALPPLFVVTFTGGFRFVFREEKKLLVIRHAFDLEYFHGWIRRIFLLLFQLYYRYCVPIPAGNQLSIVQLGKLDSPGTHWPLSDLLSGSRSYCPHVLPTV